MTEANAARRYPQCVRDEGDEGGVGRTIDRRGPEATQEGPKTNTGNTRSPCPWDDANAELRAARDVDDDEFVFQAGLTAPNPVATAWGAASTHVAVAGARPTASR